MVSCATQVVNLFQGSFTHNNFLNISRFKKGAIFVFPGAKGNKMSLILDMVTACLTANVMILLAVLPTVHHDLHS